VNPGTLVLLAQPLACFRIDGTPYSTCDTGAILPQYGAQCAERARQLGYAHRHRTATGPPPTLRPPSRAGYGPRETAQAPPSLRHRTCIVCPCRYVPDSVRGIAPSAGIVPMTRYRTGIVRGVRCAPFCPLFRMGPHVHHVAYLLSSFQFFSLRYIKKSLPLSPSVVSALLFSDFFNSELAL
jgi:hypothetical protein